MISNYWSNNIDSKKAVENIISEALTETYKGQKISSIDFDKVQKSVKTMLGMAFLRGVLDEHSFYGKINISTAVNDVNEVESFAVEVF